MVEESLNCQYNKCSFAQDYLMMGKAVLLDLLTGIFTVQMCLRINKKAVIYMEYESDILNVAVINFKPKHGDKESNLRRIKDFTVASAKRGADIILFPEMCLTGYDFYDDKDTDREKKLSLAETIPGPSTLSLAEITRKYEVYVVYGMPQKHDSLPEVLYNSAAVIGPNGIVGAYKKIHPYGSENNWCVKGDAPFMFDTKWGPISIGICYDTYHFPELMRYYASNGSRLYLNPTAIINEVTQESSSTGSGSSSGFKEGYVPFLTYGVLSNHLFIASSNLVGYDNKTFFGGGSLIVGPKITPSGATYCTSYAGDVDCNQEGVFIATIDLSLATRSIIQNNPLTGVPDYRKDLYGTFK